MSYSIASLLLIQIILIALNAVFASAELAVLSVNESRINRLAEQGSKKARRLRKLTKEPAKFLSTIQIAITLSGFLGSAFAADGFSDPLVDWLIGLGATLPRNTLDTLSVIFITLVLSYFTLIFGELVPKRIAMKKAEALSLKVSGIVSGISILFKPIVWLLSVSTNAVLKMLGIDPDEAEAHICEEDIRMMVETGGETGAIDKDEQDFIQNVFKFDDLSAGEILTHRTDLIMLWLEDTDDTWEKIICSSSFSRYPICDGSPDKVVGVLNAKVYLREKDRSRENVMRSALVPAANLGSKLGLPIVILGLILGIGLELPGGGYFSLAEIGVWIFALAVLFQIITLPVEFNASGRALKLLSSCGIMNEDETDDCRRVLGAAALTYVAAAASAILQLLRLLILTGGRRRRDD